MSESKPSQKKFADRHQISPMAALTKLLKDYFLAILGAAVVALLLRVYVVEAFRIPTDFMAPTLLAGDHIFVNKLAYTRLSGKQGPSRGDVVVFNFPNDPTKDYIKRVIAIEGDTVELRGSQLFLNGKPVSRQMDADVFEEELDGHRYYVWWSGAQAEARRMTQVKVPAGQFFVLGDNRAKGQDSRAYGFLPLSNIQGRASIIWFSTGAPAGNDPAAKAGSASSPSGAENNAAGVRWSRVFTKVN